MWADGGAFYILGMMAFALVILVLAEINQRWQDRKICVCSHSQKKHYWVGACKHSEIIGGLLFRCPCEEFRQVARVDR